jgi:hypothetical protein
LIQETKAKACFDAQTQKERQACQKDSTLRSREKRSRDRRIRQLVQCRFVLLEYASACAEFLEVGYVYVVTVAIATCGKAQTVPASRWCGSVTSERAATRCVSAEYQFACAI